MIIVGIAAADNKPKKIWIPLSRLSAHFFRSLYAAWKPCGSFNRTSEQTEHIENATEDFRETTMDVLKLAFLSSAVLEFFYLYFHCTDGGLFWF